MKLKNLIIIIAVIIIILIISLVMLLKMQKQKDEVDNIEATDIKDVLNKELIEQVEYEKITTVKNRNRFYTVVSCVNRFLQYSYEKDSQGIYNILSKEYIEKNAVTPNNAIQKVITYDIEQSFTPKRMYEINNTENISTYYVEGKIRGITILEGTDGLVQETGEEKTILIAVQLDKVNRTFAIIPDEKVPEQNNIKKLTYNKIDENKTNTYKSENISEKAMANTYFEEYRTLLNKNLDEAYNKLQKEYKDKRFPQQKDFETYIKSIQRYIDNFRIKSTTAKEYNNNIVYTCTDQYGNVYIFTEKAVLDYDVQLDYYTIENETFNESYKKANNMEKGILNADKFFKMINMQDYSAAYAVLDETFKQTYFPTQASFENYMKQKLFRYNKAEYTEYNNNISSIHAYKVKLTDATGQSTNEVEFNIVMKLLEGTDFVMSFEVN